jgi:hypothetical protein
MTATRLLLIFSTLPLLAACPGTTTPSGGGGGDLAMAAPGDLTGAAPGDLATSGDMATSNASTDMAFKDASAGTHYFCIGYDSICKFGGSGRYANYVDCVRAYDSYSLTRETCVANALGNSDCDGASGKAPCN